jgi:hypothetical protein
VLFLLIPLLWFAVAAVIVAACHAAARADAKPVRASQAFSGSPLREIVARAEPSWRPLRPSQLEHGLSFRQSVAARRAAGSAR